MPMLGTAVAFHPCAGAIGVVFFFPDGDGGFDGIDDGSAGGEGGGKIWRPLLSLNDVDLFNRGRGAPYIATVLVSGVHAERRRL